MNVYQQFSVLSYNISQTTEMKPENLAKVFSASSGESFHSQDFFYTKWAASRRKIRIMKLSDKEMHAKTDISLHADRIELSDLTIFLSNFNDSFHVFT
jgi:hypothetical protein